MDPIDRMNQAIDYVEKHMTDDLDYQEIAKIACCSMYHLQRMFPFLTGVTLSEYVRRRRLTLAAYELQNSNVKVIDLALKYGYDSPESFTRAFQNLHGTTPTAARNVGTKLKAFSRITFQISIKGASEMNYRIEELEEFSVVGLQHRVNTEEAFNIVPQLWADAGPSGLFEKLWEIRSDDHPIRGILGVCADGDHGNNEEFNYIMSMVSSGNRVPPEGLVKRDFPKTTWAVFETGEGAEGIGELWQRLYSEWVPTAAYDLAYLPAIECYLPPEENKNELWVPVVRK